MSEEKNKKHELKKAKKVKKVKNTKTNKNVKEENKQQKLKPKKKHKVLKRIILFIIIMIILACLVGAGIVAGIFFSDKYKVTADKFDINIENSKAVDADGNELATLVGNENRKIITMEEMPDYLPKAFIAIEDERFYEHSGIDILRTGKAVVTYIFNKGESSFGGSTITQQLIKNMFDDDAREGSAGVQRKIREMARAYNTEKVLSKSQILETYLNYIYMGGGYDYSDIMGVESGAQFYFSKSAKDLSLAEAAFLAGINDSPNAYYPFNPEKDNSETIKRKTKIVLGKMKELREKLEIQMTDEEYDAAIQQVESGLPFQKGIIKTSPYSYHVAAAIEQATQDLAEKEGLTYKAANTKLFGSGYTIHTTQKTEIQNRMEEEFQKEKYIVTSKEKDKNGNLLNEGHVQAAMIIIEPTTGQVVGTMGGLGTDQSTLGLNRATQGRKKPGSSIKPIACVAPALEKNIITAATVYDDSLTNFGGDYEPHNSDYAFPGLTTVRDGVARSSNIVNLKIMREVGPENAIEFMKTMGYEINENYKPDITLALGTLDVTPLEMAAAYASIANNGQYITPTFYTKVTDKEGNVVLEPKQEKRQVMTEGNAYILKSVLTSAVNHGTASVCRISGMDVAAKTGSTDRYMERWLCGFTPYYAAATWYGFDNEASTGLSINNAANIWAAIMKDVHSGLTKKSFEKPSNIVTATICKDSGKVATSSCARTTTEYFVKGTVPGKCEGHQKLQICKDTGKIANEFCPNKEEKTFLVKPEKESKGLWKTNYGTKFDVPSETCIDHKKPEIEKIEMIDVIGKKQADAKKALEAKGFKVTIKTKESNEKNKGLVIEQSIEKGKKVDKGTTVTIYVGTVKKEEKPESNTQKPTNNTVDGGTTNTITNTVE